MEKAEAKIKVSFINLFLFSSLLCSFVKSANIESPLNFSIENHNRAFLSTNIFTISDYSDNLNQKAKIVGINLAYNKNLFVNEIKLLDYFVYGDFLSFSSLINLDIAKLNLYKRENGQYLKDLNDNFSSSPDLSFGLGLSMGLEPIHFYALPVFGYRHDVNDNAYLAAKLGFLLSLEYLELELDFNKYFDKINNRGYDLEFSNTVKFKFFDDLDFYIKHKFYSNENTKIYPRKELNTLMLGFELKLFKDRIP